MFRGWRLRRLFRKLARGEARRVADGLASEIEETRRVATAYRHEIHELADRPHECPACGGALELRIGSGSPPEFWGCWNWPRCKFTANRSSYLVAESR